MQEKQTVKNPLSAVLYRFVYPCFLYFSLIIFLSTAGVYIALRSNEAFLVEIIVWLFLYSIGLALLNQLFYVKALSRALAFLIHWIGTLALFILVLVAFTGKTENIIGALFSLIPLSLVYFIFVGLYALIKKITNEFTVKKIIFPFVMYFSLSIFLTEILTYSIEVASGAPHFINQCYFIVFAAVMTLLEFVLRAKFSLFFRIALHFIGTMAAIIICFFVLAHNYVNYSDAFIPCIVIAAIYLLIAAVAVFTRSKVEKVENAEKKYDRQFL